ncbi:efflux RND transporter periplasmic adaptor subunit [Trichlorobacter lovleyi]|mgnify:CR=1 FL=1|uniref:efflux RND transporter periplasmic adaptor subunit n=1 Tax=Trichlorobacter lovleyi TaxID=313985 RepID=UPI0023F428BE|nr:efflux RND transporter periplasmic adaptor subunit [Trichlorobacter lovleyi]
MKRKLMILVIVLLLVVVALLLVKKKKQSLASLAKPALVAPVVETGSVRQGELEVRRTCLGRLEAQTKADLSARITGHILSISKREGDLITAGELVITLDNRELLERSQSVQSEVLAAKQRLAAARSALETQQAIYGRDEKLFSAGAISREALERSKTALDTARATMQATDEGIKGIGRQVAAAQTQAGYGWVTAPFSGVVTRRMMEPGDLAVPGKPILTIEQRGACKVLVQVPQEALSSLKKGDRAYLKQAGSQPLTAAVSRIYPAVGANMLAGLEIGLAEPPFGLPTGASLTVELAGSRVNGFLVPEQALIRTGVATELRVINGGQVQVRQITLLGVQDGTAVVQGGVKEGDTVAVGQESRLRTLTEGMRVAAVTGVQP